MNSTKLFNKNYAMQNIKKSKGILLIMLIVIPIITLFCLYSYNNSIYNEPNEESILIVANLIGMFIIPFIVSNILLGYVYKRNSVDFINSMPITRKKIYLTNIFTGILYLVLLQIINFIILSIYLLMAQNSLIPMAMLVDNLIIMTIAYCFMFAISSLALTVSGNKFIQVVVVMIILFLIPFIRIFNFEEVFNSVPKVDFADYNGYSRYDSGFKIEKDSIFSLPVNIMYTLTAGEPVYNINAIIYTLVLGAVYIFVGTKLFEKRKMENIGNSFESTKVHLFVKALTLYPMITLLKIMFRSIEIPELALIVVLIFVYYFVYDLITNKKVKLKTTIISFIASSAILFVVVSAISGINESLMNRKITYKKDDIKEISLELSSLYYSPYYYGRANVKINDKELADLILANWKSDYDKVADRTVTVFFKMKDNKKVSANIYLDKEVYTKVLEYILQNKDYIKQMADNYISDDMIIESNSARMGSINLKKYEALRNNINNSIEKYFISRMEQEINGDTYSNYYSRSYITTYTYKNHKKMSVRIDLDYLPDLEKDLLKMLNERCNEKIEEVEKNKFEYTISCSFIKKVSNDKIVKSFNLSLQEYKKLEEFIKENYNKEIDPQKDYYEIECYNFNFVFYTNNVDELEAIIKDYSAIQDQIYYNRETTQEYKEDAEVVDINI